MEKKNKSVRSKRSLPTDPEKSGRGSEERYRAIVETSVDGIYQVDTSGKLIFVNDSLAKTFGYKRGELLGKQFSSLLSAETIPKVAGMVKEVLSGKDVRDEFPVQHKDGHEVPVSFSAALLRANGKIIGLAGILRNVTEQKKAEEALRESEARFRNLVARSPDAIMTMDWNGLVTSWNSSAERITGYSADEMIGKHFSDFKTVPPEDAPGYLKIFESLLSGRLPETFEAATLHKDGSHRFVDVNVGLIEKGDKYVGLQVISRDITKRKRAEKALRDSEGKYRQLVEGMQEGIWGIDKDAHTTFINPRMTEILGYTVDEMQGKPLFSFMDERGIEIAKRYLERRQQGIKEQHDFEFTRKDGGRVYTSLETSPITDGAGNYVGALACVADITERKKAEEALRESEEKWRSLTENSPDYIMLLDLDSTILFINRTLPDLTKEEVIGTPNFKYIPPEYRQAVADCYKRVAASGKPGMHATPYRTKEGESRWFEVRIAPVFKNGQVTAFVSSSTDITERRLMEEKLRQSEARFRTIFEGSALGIGLVDVKGWPISINTTLEKILGYTIDELRSMAWTDYIYPEDATADMSLFREMVVGKRDYYTIEKRYLKKDREIVWGRMTLSAVRDSSGKFQFAVSMVEDITERIKSDEALRQSEERFRSVLDNSLDMVYRINLETGRYDYVSPSTEKILGYSPEEFLAFTIEEARSLAHPADLPGLDDNVIELVMNQSGKNVNSTIEYRLKHKELGYRWVTDSRSLVCDDAKGPVAVVGNLRDVTERKQAEEELWRTRERLQLIFNSVDDGIVVTDLEGIITDVNPRGLEMYRARTKDELIGKSCSELIVPEDHGIKIEELQRVLKRGATGLIEHNVLRPDGSRYTAELTASMMKDISGNPTGFVAALRDITKRKKVEEELERYRLHLEELVEERTASLKNTNERLQREIAERKQVDEELRASEERLRNIVQSIPIPVVITRMSDGAILYGNQQFVSTIGLSLEESKGHEACNFHYSPSERKDASYHLLREANIIEREFQGKRADGTTFWAIASMQRLKFEGYDAVLIAFQDITARKKSGEEQESLYQREKYLRRQLEEEMKKRVNFTRTLAHELKTPLTPVLLSSQELVAMLKDETSLRLAEIISRGASKLSGRIDELLDLAKSEIGMLKLNREYIDVLELLEEAVEEISAVSRSRGHKLIWEPPAVLPVVWADRVKVLQIVTNLLENACKFTPRGGQITINAKGEDGILIIEVGDNGPGIKEEDQNRVFKPYERLEDDRERLSGLGLGLALCKTLVELHGGQIWLKSSPGKGSTFGFSLPLGAHDIIE